jgi:hypothetical protein
MPAATVSPVPKTALKNRISNANPAAFGATDKYAVTGVGLPS